ncbi:TolB family protein [Nocardioides sp. URHA0020]|uniref:TolB family protein n=1 Tax=Nocardioides sp. URHA0020 TaxID=1380392 RepID=UPI00048B53B7|nr:PD40 domain-containing protein [Nocardioides sp. URHA0020]
MVQSRPVVALCLSMCLSICLSVAVVGPAPASGSAGTPTSSRAASSTIDDRSLQRSGRWRAVRAAKAYRRTLSKAARAGATLTTRAAGAGGSVTLQIGPRRGRAQILVGGTVRRTVSTAARKVRFRTVAVSGSGRIQVRVVAGRAGVFVDKIVLKRKSAPPYAAGVLRQVDATAGGAGANGSSVNSAAVSPDGKYVAFWSDATNLRPEATDGLLHLYVKTLATGALRVVDKSASGVLGNDGGWVSEARVIGWKPRSHELLLTTYATNLIDGVVLDGSVGPFLLAKDLDDGSVGYIAAGVGDATWSPNAAWIAYASRYVDGCGDACAPNANSSSQVFAWQVGTANYVPISATSAGVLPSDGSGPLDSVEPVWSPDSKRVAFTSSSHELVPGDTNVSRDVFVKTVQTGAIKRVSVSAGGGQANSSSDNPAFAPTGNRVAFSSTATNLVSGDDNSAADVFVKDLSSNAVRVVSLRPGGQFSVSNRGSRMPTWSPDGTRVMFMTQAFDLVQGYDKNILDDIYVKNLSTGAMQLVSVLPSGTNGTSGSTLFGMVSATGSAWAPDGRSVFFLSAATNFAAHDNNAFQQDVFHKFLG